MRWSSVTAGLGVPRTFTFRRARRLACAAAAVASATSALPRPGARCFSRIAAPNGRVQWPDLRLWLQRLPDGTSVIARQRSPEATTAFDAYSQPVPGTRAICVGGQCFYAFCGPRLGAEHLTVWRRLDDVQSTAAAWQKERDTGVLPFELDSADLPVRVIPCAQRPQLTSAVWCWDDAQRRDPNRYLEDGIGSSSWMYWESFWAPAEEATFAFSGPAFLDPARKLLAPTLGADALANPGSFPASEDEAAARHHAREGEPVASTAIGRVPKDRAYAVVYSCNVWGSDVSRSGTGSDLWSPEARLATMALEAVVDQFGVRSMLDCACGDATWMVPFFVARHSEVSYCGVDIVPEVIEQNRQRHPGVEFLAMDLAETPLPEGAELVFSKETVNHMDLPDALKALQRFRDTGARYLLTNVHEGAANEEGYAKTCYTTYIKYDYELPPFNMRKVASVIEYQGLNTSYSLFELNPPAED